MSKLERDSLGPATDRDGDALVMRAIARAKQGDMSALHFLYVRYADDVCGYLQNFVHSRDDAEDVTQNVFAKLTGAILKYEQREMPFTAWILRVARKAALDHLRASGRRVMSEHDHASLIEALAAAQAEFPAIAKEHTAKVRTKAGGEYTYRYAGLAEILAAVRPVLSRHGLALSQATRHDDRGVMLETQLLHPSTQQPLDSSVPVSPLGDDPQAFGSRLTYLRRYTLCALLGIAAEDDTDVQDAASPARPTATRGHPARPPAEQRLTRERADALYTIIENAGLAGMLPAKLQEHGVTALARLTEPQAHAIYRWAQANAPAPEEQPAKEATEND